jgi:DNA modification methylase
MQIEQWPIEKLTHYASNPRNNDHAVEQMAAAINEFGFRVPVVARSDGSVIDGHLRLKAAMHLGLAQVPVVNADDLTEAQVKAFRISVNRMAELAGWDSELLKLELIDLQELDFNLELTGLDADTIGTLLHSVDPDQIGLTDPDEVPDPPVEPIVKKGELWRLGRHLLYCGDSTKVEDVEALLGNSKADMVFTDPPYLMNFRGNVGEGGRKAHNTKHGPIHNDKMSPAEGAAFLRDICKIVKIYCNGPWYICFYRLGIDWILSAINDTGLKWRSMIVWKKNQFNLSNSDYKSLYEPIITGFADDFEPIFYGWNLEHGWYGQKNERDVWEIELPSIWEIARTRVNDLHPTMKPVELVERAISNSSRPGHTVLDLFVGSGTTFIAAERTGRSCYGMELDPKYCDVIITRWQNFTGQQAERLGVGHG